MLSISELSVEPRDRKADQSVLVLEPLKSQSGFDPVILTPGRYTIGSSADCEIVLHSHRVSPRHCLIIAGRNQTVLKSWNSQTRVNNVSIDETVLHAGDRLEIGPVEFQIRDASQHRLFDHPDQAERVETSFRKVNREQAVAVRNRSRGLSESPFGSERFSRALIKVIETGHAGDSGLEQSREQAQTQTTLDSVEQQLREREQDLNRQNLDLEERRKEFEKQKSEHESLSQSNKRDLALQDDNLQKRACEFTAYQNECKRTQDELDADFETAKQESKERTRQREEYLESQEEALLAREENLTDLISESESRKISLDLQWDELKTKKQTFAEETSLLKERQSKLATGESQLKREQNVFIESQSRFSEENIQFDEAKQTFRLDQEQLEKGQDRLSEKRTSLDAERDAFEDEKAQLEVELGNLTESQKQIAQEQNELRALRDSHVTERNCFEDEQSQLEEERLQFQNDLARLAEEQIEFSEQQASLDQERNRITNEKSEFKVIQLQIRENLLRLTKDYESFSNQRSALKVDKAQFQVEQEKLAVEQENLKAEQARLAVEQNDACDMRATLEKQQDTFDEETSQLEVELGKIKDEQIQFAEEQKEFNTNRASFDEQQSRFKADQSQFEEERREFEDHQVRLDEEQKDLNNKRSSLETETATFMDERSQLAEELRQLKDDQTRLCEELKDLDDKRKDFEEQQQSLQCKIDADRNNLDRVRSDLEAREVELVESTAAFTTEREDFASRQNHLEDDCTKLNDDLKKLQKDQESLESAQQELSQQKEELEAERKKLSDEAELFESSQNEWKQKQEADFVIIHKDDLSETDDDVSGSDDSALPCVRTSSTPSSDTGEIPDTRTDVPASLPFGLDTEADIPSEQIIPIKNRDDSLSVSKYMEDLLARSRKLQSARHTNSDLKTGDAVGPSQCIEDSKHVSVPGDNESDRSCDDAEIQGTHVTEDILVPFDPDNPPAPVHPQDTDALRFDLTTLREVANLSARSAIAQHTSKKLRGKILLKTLLSVVGFSIAAVMLSSELWLDVSYKVFGIAVAAIAAVSVLEVVRSTLLIHEMGTLKQETLPTSIAEGVIAEDACELYKLEGDLDGTAENDELEDIIKTSEPNGSSPVAQKTSLTLNSNNPEIIVLNEIEDDIDGDDADEDTNAEDILSQQEGIEDTYKTTEVDETPDEDESSEEQISLVPGDETLSEPTDESPDGSQAEPDQPSSGVAGTKGGWGRTK